MNYLSLVPKYLVIFLLLACCYGVQHAQGQTISTFAGGIGDGMNALSHGRLFQPTKVVIDSAGNLFVLEQQHDRIRKIAAGTGIITTVAGNSRYRSDWTPTYLFGAGIKSFLVTPRSMAIDKKQNIYFYDDIFMIRKLDTSGNLSQFCGNSSAGYSGDGSAATAASISFVPTIATDRKGNVYIADNSNNRVRKIDTSGIITTIAGNGIYGSTGDGGPAIAAQIDAVRGVAIDSMGNVFISCSGSSSIRKIDTGGIISTVYTSIYGELYFDNTDNLYVTQAFTIFKLNTSGSFIPIAGTGTSGYSGDGGPATAADIYCSGIAISNIGEIIIADYNHNKIRKIDTSGIINTIAGNGLPLFPASVSDYSADGDTALLGKFQGFQGLRADQSGDLFYQENNTIRKINASSGILSTVAGIGTAGFSGDGGPATAAQFQAPKGIAFDRAGNMYIADYGNHHVRKVNTAGIVSTVAGGGSSGLGDGGPATAALVYPYSVDVDTAGNLYIADFDNSRIRKVDAGTGIITTVAGGGTATSFTGAATAQNIGNPIDVVVDKNGNIFLSNSPYCMKVNSLGGISRCFYLSGYLAMDSVGNVYSSSGNMMDTNGYFHRAFGTGYPGYVGDYGPATAADVSFGSGITIDRNGQLYLGQIDNLGLDRNNISAIRKVCCLSALVDHPPLFAGGTAQTALVCLSSTANPINGIMAVTDGDSGDALRWTITSAPTHGTLVGFPFTTTSSGGTVTPSGLTYTPTTGYTGTDVFRITISDGIDTTITTVTVTISPTTSAGTISSVTSVCIGTPRTYTVSGATATGVWSMSNSNATISTTGVVTGVTPGADTILYTVSNACGTSVSTRPINVYNTFSSVTVSGASSLCTGSSSALTPSLAGGTWGSSSPTRATVSSSGVVTALSAGTVNISYVLSNPCGTAVALQSMTIVPAPNAGTITAISTLCIGTPRTYTAAGASGTGTWMMTNSNATVTSGGVVTGVTPGNDTILYIVSNSCGDDSSSRAITVYNVPTIATITGVTTLCTGTSTTLSASLAGGTWSSGSTSRATVSSTGVVTGVSAGTVNISYTLSNPCGSAVAVQAMTLNAAPNAGSIFGASTVCVGNSITLSESVTGGTWSATNSTASITSSGVVSGTAPGTDTIIYTVTNSCGTATASKIITITAGATAGTISGSPVVCVGTSTTLTSTVSGGAWITTDPYITIGTVSGVVSGVASGTAIVTYSVSSSCGTATDTALITVNPAITAGVITGASSICIGTSTTLSTTGTGGVWSSSNTSIATINSSGVVTGVTGGAALISYTVTSPCGTVVAIALINVTTSTSIGAITGPSSVCTGGTITLSHASGGGTWSSTTPSVASINTSGVVTGLTAGVTTISYTVSAGCGVSVATTNITVNSTPSAGTISGPSTLCVGATSALTSSTSGGSWASSATSSATINSTGVINALSTGSVTFTYNVTNSCGTAATTYTVAISPAPNAGTLSVSASTLCPGSAISVTSTVSGGTWSSSNTAVGTVSSTGNVTAIAGGSAIISYTVTTGCGTAFATMNLTVTPSGAGTITGVTTLCPSGTSALTSTVSGGTWSSSSSSVASISTGGTVTAIAAGTTIISYSVTGSCGTTLATAAFTVTAPPAVAAIGGTTTVCVGGSATLTDATTGGTWSSGSTGIASISSSGVITGVSAGTAVISYTVTGTCGSNRATANITVLGAPSAGSLSGASTVCVGSSASLTPTVTGGTWSSSNTTIATVNAAGAVSGVSSGSANISYSVTNSCGTGTATQAMTVAPLPNAGAISGVSTLCVGASATLTASVTGGTWSSSSSSVATVSSTGAVTGISSGSVTISYSVTNSCGTATATRSLTIYPAAVSGTISGTSTVCVGATTTLSSSAGGGVWTTSAPSIASVNTAGVVSGTAPGTVVISYTVTTGCGSSASTATITVVAPSAGTITGVTTLCAGGTSTLASTVSGGSWASTSPSVATISSSGVVTAIAAGTTVISYSVTGACGSATATAAFTVGTPPTVAAITGPGAVCLASTVSLADATAGGTWSSSNSSIASVSTAGLVRGIAAGTCTITYAVTAGCGTAFAIINMNVEVSPSAGVIIGGGTICAGTAATLTETVAGGTWTSSNIAIASVSATGVVSGISSGTATITYTVTNSCGSAFTTATETVTGTPTAGSISGITTICQGATTALTDAVTGGTWATSNAAVASVDGSGLVTGLSAGTATISYTVTNSCGSASATTIVTINPRPFIGAITGTTTVTTGSTTALYNAVSGGVWSTSNSAIASINPGGVVTGVATGTATITYTLTNSFGCTSDTTTLVTVIPTTGIENINAAITYQLFPNPATSEVAISWANQVDKQAQLKITDAVGREVYGSIIEMQSASGKKLLNLGGLSGGVYVISIISANTSYTTKLVIE